MTTVQRRYNNGSLHVELLDDTGVPVAIVADFLRQLTARGCSPNTVVAYAHDLPPPWRSLSERGLEWNNLRPSDTLGLLGRRRATPCRRGRRPPLGPMLVGDTAAARQLSPATINRVLAAGSSFFSLAILAQ